MAAPSKEVCGPGRHRKRARAKYSNVTDLTNTECVAGQGDVRIEHEMEFASRREERKIVGAAVADIPVS